MEHLRVQADLRGILAGDVLCDDYHRRLYATDAGLYDITPLGVVRPRDADDVSRLVTYSLEHQIPLFPRGGGSGGAGQSLGEGLIVDFSTHMRRLLSIDREAFTIRVQPGLVLAELNRQLATQGLIFGPDPATRAVSTLGSVLATDATGSHYAQYGSPGDRVIELKAVLHDGSQQTLSRRAWQGPAYTSGRLQAITAELGALLSANQALLQRPPWDKSLRGCGLRLEKVLDGSVVDLARLQCGAEGTLSIMTEATLRVSPLPAARAVALLFFQHLEDAARCAADIAHTGAVSACDLMDRRLMELAREADPRYDRYLRRGSEAMLLVELAGDNNEKARGQLESIIARLRRRHGEMVSSAVTTDRTERDLLWKLCRRVIQRLYRVRGDDRPVPGIDDLCVPVDQMADFLTQIQNVFKSHRVTATLYAHALSGQLHVRPFLDLHTAEGRERFESLAREIYAALWQRGGIAAGSTAFGLSRTWVAAQQLGSRYALHKRIKELFDPNNLCNPGKLVAARPQPLTANLRSLTAIRPAEADDVEGHEVAGATSAAEQPDSLPEVAAAVGVLAEDGQSPPLPEGEVPSAQRILPILDWRDVGEISEVAAACNGCGRCRTTADSERMCPVFRWHFGEEASPRAKANIVRDWLAGKIPAQSVASDEVKEIADLCFHCHQCRLDCPASVDIPRMMTEVKAQYVAANGLGSADRMLSRLDRLAAKASPLATVANWMLENRRARWLLEKFTGVASLRKLPIVADQPLHRWAARRRLTRMGSGQNRKVLIFADQYATWHNPLIGMAAVEVLQRHKINVHIPGSPLISNMAKIAMGDVESARKAVVPQLELLAEAVRAGYQIVTLEPSTALCLQREYRHLVDSEDARLVSENTTEIGRYLWNMHLANELDLNFRPLSLSVFYHLPCHLRAIDAGQPGLQLLRLIPGLRIIEAAAGCSGMAGTYGLKRSNFRSSLRIGWPMISKLQKSGATIGSTECSTCKLQMEQTVESPTIPPIVLLAHAYGGMPQLSAWINRRNDGLTVL